MKLRYKRQQFQEDAARAVVAVFAGQPYQTGPTDRAVWGNQPVVISDGAALENLRRVQRENGLPPSSALSGRFNLSVEMETGAGKTYTYIKTMYELYRAYGWRKFIVVVPSVAVREGVYQTFESTRTHFASLYGESIRYFRYQSSQMAALERFASGRAPCAMIINAQAFNARGKDARRFSMELDELRARRPIDLTARLNPVMIIDEPQSVEGAATRARLEEFCPLLTLRYSATHRPDRIYDMVYRLGALEAYRRRLVKRIAVKGISLTGGASDGGVYLERVNLSRANPTATLHFDCRDGARIRTAVRTVGPGFDLYEASGRLEEYRDGFIVRTIDGRDGSVELRNGVRLRAGAVDAGAGEEALRRVQIRETILSHLERERALFPLGIKVLSLFFLDEVANYRVYDTLGRPLSGPYARIFEEEYAAAAASLSRSLSGPGDEAYRRYLRAIAPDRTHAGYFSVDRKGRQVNSRAGRRDGAADDVDAYELIMKNKTLLLERDPAKSPVRFLFSHSALKEGWDNPNVFQICTLKQSASEVRKRQEVGRGLRLCVNQDGERMDAGALGEEAVHRVNVLTVIASESYDSFVRGLQSELAEAAGEGEGKEARTAPVENARAPWTPPPRLDEAALETPAWRTLWRAIRTKSAYTVALDTDALVRRAAAALGETLCVPRLYIQVERGELDAFPEGAARGGLRSVRGEALTAPAGARASARYDLLGQLAGETDLTRGTIARILTALHPAAFSQFQVNPEAFLAQAAACINEQKAAALTGRVAYRPLGERWDREVLCQPDSRDVPDGAAAALEDCAAVAGYVRLPEAFYLDTPVGRVHPAWAVAFHEGAGRRPAVVLEAREDGARPVEALRRDCARAHFEAVADGAARCEVFDGIPALLDALAAAGQ